MMALVGLEVCPELAGCNATYWVHVNRTVKLETDELPHFGSETQILFDTVMKEISTIRLLLRVQRKWSHYTDECDSNLRFRR